jgi:8-oxo-dGTP pyrophosphatase MutT (NUDIX family)
LLANRLSAGVVVVNGAGQQRQLLLLRAYKNWDFPKGLVEAGEEPFAAALREVREETTLQHLVFDWGQDYVETGPYNKGKVARYYIARSDEREVSLPVNPNIGMPEHHEARWVTYAEALLMVTSRLIPVVQWARTMTKD